MNKIVYFSGTGNTAYITGLIESRLRELGKDVESIPVELAGGLRFDSGSCLYLGFPVYACDMPALIKEFIGSLPEGKGAGGRIFCTKAWFSGKAVARAAKMLRLRGYNVLSTIEFVMPGSDGLAFLKKNGRAAEKLLSNFPGDFSGISVFTDESGSKFASGGTLDPLGRLVGALMNVAEGGLRKKYYADEKCTRCGRCVSICPSGNISMGGNGISFSDKCFLCMRCIHQCPVEAVQIGRSTVNKFRYKGPEGNYKPPKLRSAN